MTWQPLIPRWGLGLIVLLYALSAGCADEGDCDPRQPADCPACDVTCPRADVFAPDAALPSPDTAPGDADHAEDAAPDTTWDTERGPDAGDPQDAVAPPEATDGPADTTPDTEADVVAALPTFTATGFFRVAEAEGRHWLVTPEGAPFYSIGVNVVSPRSDVDRETGRAPYGDAVAALYENDAAWAEATRARLEDWGFNTIGAWSANALFAETMPYTRILYMSGADWLSGFVPDYFDEAFEERCRAIAENEVRPLRDDPNLIGWFIDNEQRWGPDHRSPKSLRDDYLALPEDAPGRKIAELYEDDDTGFLLAVAARFFSVSTRAIRAEDPNHLILGIRSVSIMTPPAVVFAAGPYLDVYSVNHYIFRPLVAESVAFLGPTIGADDWLRAYYELSGLPLLITEFSFRAEDSGLPNSWPPIYPVLPDQKARADAYEDYAKKSFDRPYILGHHWFQWADQPAAGRFDGEDSNFGLVRIDDTPWEELTDRMRSVNAEAPHRPPDASTR